MERLSLPPPKSHTRLAFEREGPLGDGQSLNWAALHQLLATRYEELGFAATGRMGDEIAPSVPLFPSEPKIREGISE